MVQLKMHIIYKAKPLIKPQTKKIKKLGKLI